MIKIHDLFISYSFTHSNSQEKLVGLLKKEGDFFFKIHVAPKRLHNFQDEKELHDAIYKRMKLCNVCIILAGVYHFYMDSINLEIMIAKREFTSPRPILVVRPDNKTSVSGVILDYSDEVTNWNAKSIINAIKRLSAEG